MAEFFEMPQASPTMEVGTVLSWKKAEGDALAPQDVLAEVETDKAAMEIEVFDVGVLLKIVAEEGDRRPVGDDARDAALALLAVGVLLDDEVLHRHGVEELDVVRLEHLAEDGGGEERRVLDDHVRRAVLGALDGQERLVRVRFQG